VRLRILILVSCLGLILCGCALDTRLPPVKRAIESAYASQKAAAPTRGPNDPVGAPPTGDPAGEAWPSGILNEQEAPFPAAEYLIQNRWQADFGGHHVVVYAGSRGNDPSAGVLIVQTFSMDLARVSTREFDSPAGQGALRIADVSGHLLTIRVADGTIAQFDVDRSAFLP
jgi:hypothetical protein